jgi:hypothetical protein
MVHMRRQKVPFGFSDRDGFSEESRGDRHQRRLAFGTLLTSDLLTSKPWNGVISGVAGKAKSGPDACDFLVLSSAWRPQWD